VELLVDAELRGEVARSGSIAVRERFTAERMTRQFEALYAELLSRG
jgi:hypothetical protein